MHFPQRRHHLHTSYLDVLSDAHCAFDFCILPRPRGPLEVAAYSLPSFRNLKLPVSAAASADSERGWQRFPGSRSEGPSDPQLLHRELGPPSGQAAEDGKIPAGRCRSRVQNWLELFLPGEMTGGHPRAGEPSGGDASEVDRQEPRPGHRARLQGEIPGCWPRKKTAAGLWAECFMGVGHAQLERIAHERERNGREEEKLATANDSFRQVRLTCPT